MAGKEEAVGTTGLPMTFSGGPVHMKSIGILEYMESVKKLNQPDQGVIFAETSNLNDETIFTNDAYDNVVVFLYRGETAELFPQVFSQEDEELENVLPILLDRDENQWVKLERDLNTGYALLTAAAHEYEPLLSGEQTATPPGSTVFLDLVADPNFAEVAFIRYDTEDRADIAFTVNSDWTLDYLSSDDLRSYLTKKINHIQKFYPRAMLERTPTGDDANDDPRASAKKKKKKKKKQGGGGGAARVARTNAGDAEGDVLWRGVRSPPEMQRVLDIPRVRPWDIRFATRFGEREYANLVAAVGRRSRFGAASLKENPFRRAKLSPFQAAAKRSAGWMRFAQVTWHRENRYGKLRIGRGPTNNLEPVAAMRPDEIEDITVIDHVFTDPVQFLDWEKHTEHQLVVVPSSKHSLLIQVINTRFMRLDQYVVTKDHPCVIWPGTIHSVRIASLSGDQTKEDPASSSKFARYFSTVYFTGEEFVD